MQERVREQAVRVAAAMLGFKGSHGKQQVVCMHCESILREFEQSGFEAKASKEASEGCRCRCAESR